MKCKNLSVDPAISGITMISYGAVRGEAAVVLGKAIKLCLSVSELIKKEFSIKNIAVLRRWMGGSCHAAHKYPYS